MSEIPLEYTQATVQVADYVSGKPLYARDLLSEREVVKHTDRVLGRAAGYGVIDGLTVEIMEGRRQLHVHPGAGITRGGHIINIDKDVTINLNLSTNTPTSATLVESVVFMDCDDASSDEPSNANGGDDSNALPFDAPEGRPIVHPDGVFLLIARPYQQTVRDLLGVLDNDALENRRQVSGVAFCSVPFAHAPDANTNASIFQNKMAYQAFGGTWTAKRLGMPLMTPSTSPLDVGVYGKLGDDLSALPLALFLWQNDQIVWLDLWAARRRIVQPSAASLNPAKGLTNSSTSMESWVSDRAAANGEARLYQFQDALPSFESETEDVTALFEWLPPMGYLPLRPAYYIAQIEEDEAEEQPHRNMRVVPRGAESASDLPRLFRGAIDGAMKREMIAPLRQFIGADVITEDIEDAFAWVVSTSRDYLLNTAIEVLEERGEADGRHVENFWRGYTQTDDDGNEVPRYRWNTDSLLETWHILTLLHASWRDRMTNVPSREFINLHIVSVEALMDALLYRHFRDWGQFLVNQIQGVRPQMIPTQLQTSLPQIVAEMNQLQLGRKLATESLFYVVFTRLPAMNQGSETNAGLPG